MSIAQFINREFHVEEVFGEVERTVAQLIDPDLNQSIEDADRRPEALLRLLLMINEANEEHGHFILSRAINYAFQYTPQHTNALQGYLRGLVKADRKEQRHAAKA